MKQYNTAPFETIPVPVPLNGIQPYSGVSASATQTGNVDDNENESPWTGNIAEQIIIVLEILIYSNQEHQSFEYWGWWWKQIVLLVP